MRPNYLRCLFLSLVALTALLCTASARGAAGWKAGVAEVNITPREQIWLAGYAFRNRPSEGVLQDIYAKALAVQDARGSVVVLVTSDLVGISRSMADEIARRAKEKFNLPRDRLVLNASHTHSAPVAGEALHLFYDMNNAQKAVTEKYTRKLLDQIVELIGESIKRLTPAELAFGQGLAGFAVNRRRAAPGKRHLPGPVDHDVPVLRVRDGQGNLRAVVFGYACHPTSLSGYQINGDYPGFAQEEIEKAHPGATAMFVAGCGADANPLPRIREALTEKSIGLAATYGRILAAAVELALQSEMQQLDGSLKTAWQQVDLPFQQLPSREQLSAKLAKASDDFGRRQFRYLLAVLDRDGKLPDRYAYPVQVWQFGEGLTFIALAGEPVVDYALRFKGRYGWDKVWVAGYCNDLPSYIPSRRVLAEGGYEGGEGMPGVGLPTAFNPIVEEIIADKVDELIRRTGN